MKENFNFIGRKYEKAEIENAQSALQEWSRDSIQRISGESEKTPKEIKIINAVGTMIETELRTLGIMPNRSFDSNKIHIFNTKEYQEYIGDKNSKGEYSSTLDSIIIDKEISQNDARLFSILIHENIHQASTQKFYINKDQGIFDSRVGYRINSEWKKDDRKNRFRGFNEVMVDATTFKILMNNQEYLNQEFGITKEELNGPIFSYMDKAPILDSILKKVAVDNNKTLAEVFEIFEKGQFESTILNLKVIEQSFGSGSLQILSLLDHLDLEEDNLLLQSKILNYFSETDSFKRSAMGKDILDFYNQKSHLLS